MNALVLVMALGVNHQFAYAPQRPQIDYSQAVAQAPAKSSCGCEPYCKCATGCQQAGGCTACVTAKPVAKKKTRGTVLRIYQPPAGYVNRWSYDSNGNHKYLGVFRANAPQNSRSPAVSPQKLLDKGYTLPKPSATTVKNYESRMFTAPAAVQRYETPVYAPSSYSMPVYSGGFGGYSGGYSSGAACVGGS